VQRPAPQRFQRRVIAPAGLDRHVAEQAIGDNEARIGSDDVGSRRVRDQQRGLGRADEAMGNRLAILAGRDEIGGEPQIVDVDRFALQAIRLLAQMSTVPRVGLPRELSGIRFLPRFLDHRRRDLLSCGEPPRRDCRAAGSIFAGLRRMNHTMRAWRTRPFTCAAKVWMPKKRRPRARAGKRARHLGQTTG
jgi:hypothetical protein